jgi:hypothetical protein
MTETLNEWEYSFFKESVESGLSTRKVDTLGFSTFQTLSNGETYDSTILNLGGYTQVQTDVLSDVNGTITIDFIRDEAGTDILRTLTIPYTGGDGYQTFSAPAFTPYVRYRFTADEAGQADFYFDTKLLTKSLSGQLLGLDAFISPKMVANLGRNIIVGKTNGGHYANVSIEPVSNRLAVDVPKSAFGELEAVNPTPVVQVDFIYNINADLVASTTTGSGVITQADAMAVLQTSATTSSSAKISTNRFVKYRPGQGVHVRGTALFTTGVAGSTQLFGAGDDDNGVFFGFNGESFGVMRRSGGVDTWVAQTAWNGDKFDGSGGASNPTASTLDVTKGNVYEIQFQWLGFGEIVFAIEDEQTGRFVPVHTIPYANNNIAPSMLNPSFPIIWEAINTTNDTNITVKGASCCAEIEGNIRLLGPRNSIDNSKTGVGTSLTNILTIRNKSTFQSQTNKTPVIVSKYSAAVDGTKPATFQLVLNATLGGTPSYTDISTNTSVIDYDTAGTTVTGGKLLDGAALGKAGAADITPFLEDVQLNPGDTLTLAVKASTGTTDTTCFVKWIEDF